MSIGKLIVQERKRKNISQERLAEKIGICRASLSYYEREKIIPNIDILKRISKVLGIPLSTFITKDEKLSLKDQEVLFMSLLRKEEELYSKVMKSPSKEIKKWKYYSKIDYSFINYIRW